MQTKSKVLCHSIQVSQNDLDTPKEYLPQFKGVQWLVVVVDMNHRDTSGNIIHKVEQQQKEHTALSIFEHPTRGRELNHKLRHLNKALNKAFPFNITCIMQEKDIQLHKTLIKDRGWRHNDTKHI